MKLKTILPVLSLSIGTILLNSCAADEGGNVKGGVPDKDLITRIQLNDPERDVINSLDGFNHQLMQEMASRSEDGEFCVSPISVSISLAMLANSSNGTCQNQLLNALGTDDLSSLNSLNQKLMQYLPNDANGSSINIANNIWISNKYHATEAYTNVMRKWYYAGIDYIDFSKKSSTSKINNWVANNTNGKISDFLDGASFDPDQIEMICGNAVYFKGDWYCKFPKSDTKPEIFHSPSGDKTVDMMHSKQRMYHSYNDILQVIALEFEDSKNEMYVFLPDPGVEIAECLAILTPEEFLRLRRTAKDYKVTLSIPKFEVQSKCDLDNILAGMGIDCLGNVDLSPMGIGERTVKVLNQSSLKIDEDGAELAAFTAATGLDSFNPPADTDELTVNVDRPFIYIIRNSATGATLMAGAVTNP